MPDRWERALGVLISAVAIGGVIFGYLFADAELILLGMIGASTAIGVGYSIRRSRGWQ